MSSSQPLHLDYPISLAKLSPDLLQRIHNTKSALCCVRCTCTISHSLSAKLVRCPVCCHVNVVSPSRVMLSTTHILPMIEEVQEWTCSQIAEFLLQQSLQPPYALLLSANNVDGQLFLSMTRYDFIALGLRDEGVVDWLVQIAQNIRQTRDVQLVPFVQPEVTEEQGNQGGEEDQQEQQQQQEQEKQIQQQIAQIDSFQDNTHQSEEYIQQQQQQQQNLQIIKQFQQFQQQEQQQQPPQQLSQQLYQPFPPQ